MKDRRAGVFGPFLALGVAFIAIGASGRTPFLALGIVFVAIAIGQARRGRRS